MSRRLTAFRALVVGAVLAVTAQTASATVVSFNDRAAFIGATGATNTNLAPQGFTSGTFTQNGLRFSRGPGASNHGVSGFTSLIAGPEYAISGPESFNVDFLNGPIVSFGFDFVEAGPSGQSLNGRFVDSTFSVNFLRSGSSVGTTTFARPNDQLTFVGFVSSVEFDRVQIVETVGLEGNEFFQNFLTGTAAAVPAPGTLALFGLGLLGAGFARRRA